MLHIELKGFVNQIELHKFDFYRSMYKQVAAEVWSLIALNFETLSVWKGNPFEKKLAELCSTKLDFQFYTKHNHYDGNFLFENLFE